MTGLSFWATGYCVSTVGLDEEMIRKYIRDQNAPDSQYDALNTNNNQPLQGLSLGQCPLREGFIKPRPTGVVGDYYLNVNRFLRILSFGHLLNPIKINIVTLMRTGSIAYLAMDREVSLS